MTSAARMRNHAPILSGLILILIASTAHAQDMTSYNQQQQDKIDQQQLQDQNKLLDKQYKLPRHYDGKYYPNDEPVIGYHGTSNTSKNDDAGRNSQNDTGRNGSFYYYYY